MVSSSLSSAGKRVLDNYRNAPIFITAGRLRSDISSVLHSSLRQVVCASRNAVSKRSPCDIVATLLFALAAIAGLTPTLALLIFWDKFLSSWLDDISKYHIFVGALIFGASMASIGAVLTRWNQRTIYDRQLAAKRREQDLTLGPKKQQIAAAFIDEIDAILSELHHEFLKPIENALRAMESRAGKIDVGRARIGHLRRFFDRSPGNVRLFPSTISQGLMRFYAIVEETKLDLDWYSHAIETSINQNVRLMNRTQMIRLLKKILGEIDSSSKSGRTLIEELKKIRDAELL